MAYQFSSKPDANKQKELLEKQTGKKYRVYREDGRWCVDEAKRKPVVDWDAVERDFDEGWD